MRFFRSPIDIVTLGSSRPFLRLGAYYAILVMFVALVSALYPPLPALLLGNGLETMPDAPRLLQDGLAGPTGGLGSQVEVGPVFELGLVTALALLGALALMLPVTWVYMSARRVSGHDQSVVQTLIILPIVVAGIVFIVRNNLALAFSLAGVVAAVRFRTTLRDARDVVFIFLAIAVGFAAGVQLMAVGALVSLIFNYVLLFTWRYDFGRNVLEPTAASQWSEPLNSLVKKRNGSGGVPDRDLVLALTPQKVDALAQRFDRVRNVVGPKKKKPRFNAVLSITSDKVADAQVVVQKVLDKTTKRWMLDQVVTHTGKPSEMYYLVRLGKSVTSDGLITAIRARAGEKVVNADVEIGEALAKRQGNA